MNKCFKTLGPTKWGGHSNVSYICYQVKSGSVDLVNNERRMYVNAICNFILGRLTKSTKTKSKSRLKFPTINHNVERSNKVSALVLIFCPRSQAM